jgi:hypothetical protein
MYDFYLRYGATCEWLLIADMDEFFVFPQKYHNWTSFLNALPQKISYVQFKRVELCCDMGLDKNRSSDLIYQVKYLGKSRAPKYIFQTDFPNTQLVPGIHYLLGNHTRPGFVVEGTFCAHARYGTRSCSVFSKSETSLRSWLFKELVPECHDKKTWWCLHVD